MKAMEPGHSSSRVVLPSLQLSPAYTGKTCGLCGNYNGNRGDDFLTPSGLVESLVEDFGNAWKLRPDCADLPRQPGDPCALNPRLSTCIPTLSPRVPGKPPIQWSVVGSCRVEL